MESGDWHRSTHLELVMAVKTKLRAKTRSSSPGRGVATNRKLVGEWVAVKLDTEDGEEDGKVVADTVHVLLSVGELSECDDTVTSQEAVVGGGVQTTVRLSVLPYNAMRCVTLTGMVLGCRSWSVSGTDGQCPQARALYCWRRLGSQGHR